MIKLIVIIPDTDLFDVRVERIQQLLNNLGDLFHNIESIKNGIILVISQVNKKHNKIDIIKK